jgi:hypothetical protein
VYAPAVSAETAKYNPPTTPLPVYAPPGGVTVAPKTQINESEQQAMQVSASVPAFKPVNPVSAETQKVLLANRTQTYDPQAGTPMDYTYGGPAFTGNTAGVTPWWTGNNYATTYGGDPCGCCSSGKKAVCLGKLHGGRLLGGGSCCGSKGAMPVSGVYGGGCTTCSDGSPGVGSPFGVSPCGGSPGCGAAACGACASCGGFSNCGHLCGLLHHKTPGNFVPHLPNCVSTRGYYYFRPYHVMHVYSQQELASRWGGDSRNPYDNSMFEEIYARIGTTPSSSAKIVAKPAPAPAVVVESKDEKPTSVTPTPLPKLDEAADASNNTERKPVDSVAEDKPVAPKLQYIPIPVP